MKILSLTVCIALVAWSQDRSPLPEQTLLKDSAGRWNGRLWKTFNANEKAVFLIAFSSAIDQAALVVTKGRTSSSKLAAVLFPGKLTGQEILSALDKFYDAPENAPVAISDALMGVSRRSNQLDVDTITQTLDYPCGKQ
jgi:hypothetical protein